MSDDPYIEPFDVEVPFDGTGPDESVSGGEALVLFLDAAVAHRDEAVGRGFSPEAAEAMAVSVHSGLVAVYFANGVFAGQ